MKTGQKLFGLDFGQYLVDGNRTHQQLIDHQDRCQQFFPCNGFGYMPACLRHFYQAICIWKHFIRKIGGNEERTERNGK